MATFSGPCVGMCAKYKTRGDRGQSSLSPPLSAKMEISQAAHQAGETDTLWRVYEFACWCSRQPEQGVWNAAGVAFFAVMIIPDSVRTGFQDNPIGGLAMYLAGPLSIRIVDPELPASRSTGDRSVRYPKSPSPWITISDWYSSTVIPRLRMQFKVARQSALEPQIVVVSDFQKGSRIEALQAFEWHARMIVPMQRPKSNPKSLKTNRRLAPMAEGHTKLGRLLAHSTNGALHVL